MRIFVISIFLGAAITGCGDDGGTTDADADTDADTDTDSDTDTDTGSGTGTSDCRDEDCDDGLECNGVETCDASGECAAGEIDPAEDLDGDGFSTDEGDCDECQALSSPGRIEASTGEGEGIDDDCDGEIDEALEPCDGGLVLDSEDPLDAARALGLCEMADDVRPGVVAARWVRANGDALASPGEVVGITDVFGPNVSPIEGDRLLVLSTGRARTPSQSGACGSTSCTLLGVGTPPPGFPADVPGCPVNGSIADDVALEVDLVAPTNAIGYNFQFDYYTFEHPEYVCTSYNDQFVTLADPAPGGVDDGNIAYDSEGNPVTVNSELGVCTGCPLGAAELTGTGFDTWGDAGATGWLGAAAPISGGESITLRFIIYDVGDTNIDSTVLLDNFVWLTG